MSWWSARNWCEAQGTRLLDISGNRLGCYQSDGITPFGDKTTGSCCAEGQAKCGNDKTKQSAIMQALRSEWDSDFVWVHGRNSSSSFCQGLGISLSFGGVGTVNHNTYYYSRTLCE